MKTSCTNFIFPIFLFFFSTIYCQDTLTIDYPTKEITGLDSLNIREKGDLFYIRLNNLNTRLYDVKITSKDSTINYKSLPENIFNNLYIDDLTKLIVNIPPIGQIISIIETASETEPIATENMKESNSLSSYNKVLSYLAEIIPDIKQSEPTSTLTPEIKRKLAMLIKVQLDEIIKEHKKLLSANNKRIQSLKKEINNFGLDLINLKAYSKLLTPNTKFINPKLSPKQLKKDIIDFRDSISAISNSINTGHLEYIANITPILSSLQSTDSLKLVQDAIKEVERVQLEGLGKMDGVVNNDSYEKALIFLVDMANNESNYFQSFPMQISGDVTSIIVKVIPKDTALNLFEYETNLKFPIKKKKKFWTLSIGTYLSTIYDEGYSVVPESSNSFIIKNEDPNKLDFGANALITFGKIKENADFNWHYGLGAGVSIINNIKPRLMLSTGIAWGKKEKISINGGLVLGSREQLSKGFSDGQQIDFQPDKIMVSSPKVGVFISANYSIFSKSF